MNTKQRDILSTQGNADDNPKQNSTLVESEEIKGTPFTLRRDDKHWFITIANYRITETTLTKEEQIEKLESEKWLLIMNLCIIAIQKISIENNHYKNYEERIKKLQEEIPNYETESL